MKPPWMDGWLSRRVVTFHRHEVHPYTERYPVQVTIKAGEAEVLKPAWWELKEGMVNGEPKLIPIYHSPVLDGTHIPCNGHCKPDFSDIRFTELDGITLIGQWIQGVSGEGPDRIATAWVGIDFRGQLEALAYMYHDNPKAEHPGVLGMEKYGLYIVGEEKEGVRDDITPKS